MRKDETLILLGTGHATVTKCYNTCFALFTGEEYFLVDTGGGNGILRQLEDAEIPLQQIHHIFISHEHTDHILGLIWLIRMIATKMRKGDYEGSLNIYCHKELAETIQTICGLTLQGKLVKMIGERICFHKVKDGKEKKIAGYDITFFDILSTKAKQFGFALTLHNGKKFVFVGDEPYREHEHKYAYQADWFLHEAFCRDVEKDRFKPYEKHHTTVKDACKIGEKLNAVNMILYHTEDKCIQDRKRLYLEEGRKYYKGNLFVPYDLEEFIL